MVFLPINVVSSSFSSGLFSDDVEDAGEDEMSLNSSFCSMLSCFARSRRKAGSQKQALKSLRNTHAANASARYEHEPQTIFQTSTDTFCGRTIFWLCRKATKLFFG